MWKPTRLPFGEGCHPRGKRATRAPAGSTGVVAAARMEEGDGGNTAKPRRWCGTHQPESREGQAGPVGVAERPVVLRKPGNAGGGKGPWFESSV